MKFIYCPKCGAKLEEKYSWDEGGVPYCVKDDLLFFDVPKHCIMVAVIKDDEVLLLKQSYIYKNSRVLISGYIGIDEKAEDTVHREVLEETGIKIDNVRFLGTEYIEGKELLMLTFMAFYRDGHIIKSDEVEAVSWEKLSKSLELMSEDVIGKKVIKKVLDILKR